MLAIAWRGDRVHVEEGRGFTLKVFKKILQEAKRHGIVYDDQEKGFMLRSQETWSSLYNRGVVHYALPTT